jgi:hypothetical protein
MQDQLQDIKDIHYHLLNNTINVFVYVYNCHIKYQIDQRKQYKDRR